MIDDSFLTGRVALSRQEDKSSKQVGPVIIRQTSLPPHRAASVSTQQWGSKGQAHLSLQAEVLTVSHYPWIYETYQGF